MQEAFLLDNTRKLAFCLALGLSVIIVLYPPFTICSFGASLVEYGFLFTGPATVRNAAGVAREMLGPQAGAAATGLTYSLDIVRLLIELAVVWAIYVTLLRTVLRRPQPVSAD